jgi:hypothetical protein
MAAVRFRSSYYSVAGTAWQIDIWDNSHSGAITTFETETINGAEIRYTPEGKERHSPICSSECSFTFIVENATHAALITDLAGAAESRFWVAVYKAGALQWSGVILTDAISYQDLEYPFPFQITAADGLAALKDTQYDNAGTRYTGAAKILTHVLAILNKLPQVASIWGGSDEFLRTSIDWWDTNGPVTPGSTDDPWNIYWAQNEVFYTFDKGEARVMSCYDVLSAIMTAWGARIYLVDGVFWCEQIGIRSASSFYARNYSKAGTQLSVDNATGDNTIDQASVSKITGLQYQFYPALKTVEVEYQSRNRRNYLAGWDGSNTPPQSNVKIKDNSGSATISLSFGISLTLTNDTYSTDLSNYLALMFSIDLRVGTDAVLRTGNIYSGGIQYNDASWQFDNGTIQIVFWWPVIAPVIGQTIQYQIPFEILTPPLTSSGDWDIVVLFDGAYDQGGTLVDTSNFTWDIDVTNPYMEVFSYGQPQTSDDSILYKASNPTAGNTAVLEYETIIGDADNPNSIGRLQYGADVASLVDTGSWGDGVATRNKNIGDLIARTVLNGQLTPIRRMLGELRGDFLVWRRWYQDLDGSYWLMLGGTYSTGQDAFNGEWFLISYGSGAVSVTPTRRRVNIFPTTSLPTTPVSSNGPGILQQGVGNVDGFVIAPLANHNGVDYIPAGAVTTINIAETLGDFEYQNGETIRIVNPITGTFEVLDVDADATNGDTFISVTGTLSHSYPANSYIIKTPAVGITTLPGGEQGSILYKGPEVWEALPPDTAGFVLMTGGAAANPYWADSGAILPSGSSTQTLRYNSSNLLEANGAITNDGTYIGIGGDPDTGHMVYVKQNASTKGLAVVRTDNDDEVHIYHDGTAKIESVGGNNLALISASGSLINLIPGGGGGQQSQVQVAPGANITSNLGNTGLVNVFGTYAPTTSGGDFSIFRLGSTINQTGAADQDVDGLRIVPTLTAVVTDFRGIHYVPSTQTFLWQPSGTSVRNHLIGNLGIGTGTGTPGGKVHIVGNGTTSGTYGLKVYDGAGTPAIILVVRDDKRIGVLTASPAVTIDAATATDSIALPTGTTAQRPSVNSSIRINSTVGGLEIRNAAAWNRLTCTTTPTIAAGAAAGTGPTVSINSGNDLCHEVQVDVGTSPTTGVLCTVTFNQALDPGLFTYPVFCARNGNACAEITKLYIYNAGNSSYQIYANAAPTASTTYLFNVIVKQ